MCLAALNQIPYPVVIEVVENARIDVTMPEALLVHADILNGFVLPAYESPLNSLFHDAVDRLPVQPHHFRHLGDVAAGLQPHDDGLRQQLGVALVAARPRYRNLLNAAVLVLHARDLGDDERLELTGVQMPPGALRPLVQRRRELGVGVIPLGLPVHLGTDNNPFGLHVQIHVHDLPR